MISFAGTSLDTFNIDTEQSVMQTVSPFFMHAALDEKIKIINDGKTRELLKDQSVWNQYEGINIWKIWFIIVRADVSETPSKSFMIGGIFGEENKCQYKGTYYLWTDDLHGCAGTTINGKG